MTSGNCTWISPMLLALRPGLTCYFHHYSRMKSSGEQFEDRVVEVHWDPVVEGWRMMRFRDDKPTGNFIKTVESVIESIQDGVEKETVLIPHDTVANGTCFSNPHSPQLLEKCVAIRAAWKARHNQPNQPPGPPPHHGAGPPNIPPGLASRGPCHLLSPNLHTRTHSPTCKRVNPNLNNIPSRMLRRACKAFPGSRKPR